MYQTEAWNPLLREAAAECGLRRPSPSQLRCLQPALDGRSFLCQAPSGSGKTVACLMIVLHRLLHEPQDSDGSGSIRALILCHSRELVSLIAWQFRRLSRVWPAGLGRRRPRVAEFCGGASEKKDAKLAAAGLEIAVGTPGRMYAMLQRGELRLGAAVTQVVLEECDHLMLGYDSETLVRDLIDAAAPDVQVMMVCTTLSEEVRQACLRLIRDPVDLSLESESLLALPRLLLYRVPVAAGERNDRLIELLGALEFDQMLIFASSSRQCEALVRLLRKRGYPAIGVHGAMVQGERMEKYLAFRSGRSRIAIATELYARGLQFDGVSVVINYSLDGLKFDSFLHRVGRVGRFGGKGLALTLVSSELGGRCNLLTEVESRLGIRIPVLPNCLEVSAYMDGRAGTLDLKSDACNFNDFHIF